MSRMLQRFFMLICTRELLILLAFAVAAAAVPVIIGEWTFLRGHGPHDPEAVEDLERLIDGIAGVLVAAGVFLESRETLRKMALHHTGETDPLQLRLNEVAHHNGMGLLLVGLFMEIGTALVGLPERFVNMRAAEGPVFAGCLVLTVIALAIIFDFVKDYVRTYWSRFSD